MTIRFVSARPAARTHLPDQHKRQADPANDNTGEDPFQPVPPLADALAHFAKFGLHSARAAWIEAEAAYNRNDLQKFEYWAGLSRMFDGAYACRMQRALTEEALSA